MHSTWKTLVVASVIGLGLTLSCAAGRDDDGSARRSRPKMPEITKPVLFNTPEADQILAALQVFPADNPWNEDISNWPVHPNSKNIIASIGADKPLRCNRDMNFVLVPPQQKKVAVGISRFADESDKGPFPVPDNMPIEGWPVDTNPKEQSLPEIQRTGEGDRHAVVVDPVNGILYEFYQARKTTTGWTAVQASVFDLKTNKLRPVEWTSTDAAGLPIFPAIVRYDEIKRGLVDHAMRVTVKNTRRAFVHPARHFASRSNNQNFPRMGERIRLRKDYDISGFSPAVRTILKGLKIYGMFVADNGLDWFISISPDARIDDPATELRTVKGSAFEVVQKEE